MSDGTPGWRPGLVALDIDGTLLKWIEGAGQTYEVIPDAVYDAVHRAYDAGAHIVLTPKDMEEIDAILPVGFAHGARYSDQQNIGPEGYA